MDLNEKIAAAVQTYFDCFNAQDAEGIADIYAVDATVNDPVTTPAKNGKDEIRAFYTMAVKNGAVLKQNGPTRIVGNMAAFAFTVSVGAMTAVDKAVDVELPKGGMTIDVIDTFEFNDDGKVTAMKAYWGPTNVTQV